VRYWGSTIMDLDAQGMVDILAIRWKVETFFEYEKDLLGSGHYQVMTRQGVLRFWTLTACLQCFLEELRSQEPGSLLTCGTFGVGSSKNTAEIFSFGWKHASSKVSLSS
jgi:hypothetical protein